MSIEFLSVSPFSINMRVLINKRGHTFDGYTGVVHDYRVHQGKVKHIDIRLDDGQDMKGGNGFTFVSPKALIKLTWGKSMNRQAELTKRFRKCAWGRLYWKANDRRNLRAFESDDVCIVRDGTVTIHYKTIEGFIEELEEWEMWEAIVTEDMREDYGDGESGGNHSHIEVR